jgi:hypothetical protein
MPILLLNRNRMSRVKNARIYVGNTPFKKGVVGNEADLCATYAGPLYSNTAVITGSKQRTGK